MVAQNKTCLVLPFSTRTGNSTRIRVKDVVRGLGSGLWLGLGTVRSTKNPIFQWQA